MKRVIIAISALAATGALAAILLALGITSPEFVLARAAKRAAQLRSVHVEGTVTGIYATYFDESFRARITPGIDTDEEVMALFDPQARVSFEMDAVRSFVGPDMDARIVTGGPKHQPITLRLRMLLPRAYLRYEDVPTTGRRGQPGYVGQWFDIDTFAVTSSFSGSEPRLLSGEQEEAWREALANSRIFLPDGPIYSQTVGGRAAWVVPVHVSAEGLAEFRTAEANIVIRDGSYAIYYPQPEDAAWHGMLTIDKKTFDILAAKLTNIPEAASPGPQAATLDLTFSRHDEPLAITAPERSQAIVFLDPLAPPALSSAGLATSTPAVGERMGSSLQPASSTTSTGSTDDTDGDGLSDVLENFYGSNPRNPDTDGDGRTDGAEVTAGDDPAGPGKLFQFGVGATSTP